MRTHAIAAVDSVAARAHLQGPIEAEWVYFPMACVRPCSPDARPIDSGNGARTAPGLGRHLGALAWLRTSPRADAPGATAASFTCDDEKFISRHYTLAEHRHGV
jgi:hypothetical protein